MRIHSPYLRAATLISASAAAVLCPAIAQQLQSPVPGPDVEDVRQALAPLGAQRRGNAHKVVKGIYLSFWSASMPSRVDNVIQLAQDGLINTVVIDVKDVMGRVAFDSKVPQSVEYRSRERIISDLGGLVRKLHAGGLHVVARIVTFNDAMLARARPDLAVHSKARLDENGPQLSADTFWQDERGLLWVDPGARQAWDYNIAIAKDALSRGVDEVNFDYVRFPSGGSLDDMHLPVTGEEVPKRDVIVRFFKHLREQLPDARLSADLFGLVTVARDDLGIGQVIEDALPYFDALCPMVYPSHYAEGFYGFENPAEHPYEVVNYSMRLAAERLRGHAATAPQRAELIPWLQDFSIGAEYDADMVRAQIRAVSDALGEDYRGFLLWSPKNQYSTAALR
ncbi:MAG: hypothetical protein F4Y47_04845 [Acidobacteriia bacterium]|nr:hypothetical protein [Terriglobia bacterium]MYG01905.1 hypothetical protein [Terriglobia bacterium]MYK10746.1 hypothetical protein [Terriglobia bacterium]